MRFQPIELPYDPDEFFIAINSPKALIDTYSSSEHIKVHPSTNRFKATKIILDDIFIRMRDIGHEAYIGLAQGELGVFFMDYDYYVPVYVDSLLKLSKKNKCAAYLVNIMVSHCEKASFYCDFDKASKNMTVPTAQTIRDQEMIDFASRLIYYRDHAHFTGAISNEDSIPNARYFAGFSEYDYRNDEETDLYEEGVTWAGFIYISDFCNPEEIQKAKELFEMMDTYETLRKEIEEFINNIYFEKMTDINQLELQYDQPGT